MTHEEAAMHRDLITLAERHIPELEEGSDWWSALWTFKRISRDALEREDVRHLEAVR